MHKNIENIIAKDMVIIYPSSPLKIRPIVKVKIKQILNIDNPIASIIDANEIITTGEYQAGINSKHMPIENESGLSTQEFKLVIYKHNNTISQQAFEITTDTIWYRTGTIANTDVTWTEWKSNKTTI